MCLRKDEGKVVINQDILGEQGGRDKNESTVRNSKFNILMEYLDCSGQECGVPGQDGFESWTLLCPLWS